MLVQCGAISDIFESHNYTDSWNATMRAAIHDGGTDVACDSAYPSYILAAYQNGSISLADLQAAATNFLRQAFELGLMDPPDQASYLMKRGPPRSPGNLSRCRCPTIRMVLSALTLRPTASWLTKQPFRASCYCRCVPQRPGVGFHTLCRSCFLFRAEQCLLYIAEWRWYAVASFTARSTFR